MKLRLLRILEKASDQSLKKISIFNKYKTPLIIKNTKKNTDQLYKKFSQNSK